MWGKNMETTTVEEFVTKINELPAADRAELLRRLIQPAPPRDLPRKAPSNGTKRLENPNLKWIKKNKSKYAGNYVALKDGKLIAFGRTIKEADQAAKAKGVEKPFLHYLMAEGEVAWWGGWS